MGSYKHIETCIGEYIAKHYTDTVEVGIGKNTTAAQILHDAGVRVRCTDVKDVPVPACLSFFPDDILSPDDSAPGRVGKKGTVRPFSLPPWL
jgi:uncharacterized UPF0146 family protein